MLLLLLPSVVGFFIFYILPFILSFYFALIDNSVGKNFVGLLNFASVLKNGAFQLAIKNTVILLAVYLPMNICLPLIMALCIQKVNERWKDFFIFIFLLPLIIPSGTMVTFWNAIVGINGLINKVFFMEAPVDWINTQYARFIIVFISTWKNAGYNMVFFLTGLGFISKEFYEFAKVEGANAFQIFKSITIPCLIPSFFLVIVMSIVNFFNSFKEIHLLAGPYPNLSIYMLQHYINNQFAALNYQRLSAASYILSVFFFIMSFLILKYQEKALGEV